MDEFVSSRTFGSSILDPKSAIGNRQSPWVSVVVPNWNGAAWLGQCLDSLRSQRYPNYEVLVVDNGSTDESRQIASKAGRWVQWIALPENLGFAGGVNVGLTYCRGELVALLNNDATADPDWLLQLVAGLNEAGVGMAASKILRWGEPATIDKAGHLIYWDGQNRGRGTGEADHGQFEDIAETLFPDGCAALYRRELLDETGGFDPMFFAYGDDADLGMRSRLLGWKCVYVPRAVVRHRGAATSGKFSKSRVLWIERNRLWLALKCFPLELLLLAPLLTAWRLFWNVISLVARRGSAARFRLQGSVAELLVALAGAYWQGLNRLAPVLKARRRLWRNRQISRKELFALLWKFRIGARQIALRD